MAETTTERFSVPWLIATFKRPVVIILIVGILIRLLLSPIMTTGYDVYHWALTISNFQSDNGLYGLSGYYYTPVWGYILGVTSFMQDLLANIPIFGDRFLEVIPLEEGGFTKATATITTVGFNVSLKIILFIADILVGYLIYGAVKDHTGDEKKATMSFALWFLCPIVIVVSSVCGMFDAFSVLFLLMATLLAYHSKYLLAGSMFALSILTKFFPLFFLMFFVAYILMKHRDDGMAKKNLLLASIGAAIATVVVYIPQILHGTVSDSFFFLLGRTGNGMGTGFGSIETYGTVIAYITIFAIVTFVAWKYYKKGDSSPGTMMKFMLLTAVITLLYPPTPQYVLIMLPFLIFVIVSRGDMMIPWKLLSVFVTAFALTSMFTLFLSYGAYDGVLSLDSIVSLTLSYRTTVEMVVYLSLGALQYISILSVLYFLLKDRDLCKTLGLKVKEVTPAVHEVGPAE